MFSLAWNFALPQMFPERSKVERFKPFGHRSSITFLHLQTICRTDSEKPRLHWYPPNLVLTQHIIERYLFSQSCIKRVKILGNNSVIPTPHCRINKVRNFCHSSTCGMTNQKAQTPSIPLYVHRFFITYFPTQTFRE